MSAIQERTQNVSSARKGAPTEAYADLLAVFLVAHHNMKTTFENLNAVLVAASIGVGLEDRHSRIAAAARAYEEARDEVQNATAMLNTFLIDYIVASNPSLKPQRYN